jgi:hypothetical protein
MLPVSAMCARRGLAAAFAVGVLACRRDNPVRPATDVAPVAIDSLTSADLARKVDKPLVAVLADRWEGFWIGKRRRLYRLAPGMERPRRLGPRS